MDKLLSPSAAEISFVSGNTVSFMGPPNREAGLLGDFRGIAQQELLYVFSEERTDGLQEQLLFLPVVRGQLGCSLHSTLLSGAIPSKNKH